MSSLIPGYEYDIFISYRQKDNRMDGWITEFVEHFQRELEATFKDEISVYFDINPHDGLLETHDVDASLKDKLKCLIFIPIISRTYCDPRSFAWDHEFRAFVDQASQDRFGLKIKLPGGNVANRVLPVRIHDLNAEDLHLCESIIGGYLRGVDFIYKSPGVNRPLRAHEDHPHDNLNKTFYRDQINKVANAVDEILTTMKKDQGKPVREEKAEFPDRKIREEKPPEKKEIKDRIKTNRNGRVWAAFVLAFLVLLCGGFYIHHRIMIKWARTQALAEIQQLYNEFTFPAAFDLLQRAKKYIPDDPQFKSLESALTKKLTILTDPAGAEVFIKNYSSPGEEWKKIGVTPIEDMPFPCFTYYQLKLVKKGYETIVGAMATQFDPKEITTDTISRKLFLKGTLPAGMVYVEGYWDEVSNRFLKECGFFIDMYEVTNRDYKNFMDKGGYRNPAYWKNEFVKEGKKLSLEEALSLFVDKTGRPGPSTWGSG